MHTLHVSIPIRKKGTNALQVVIAERRGPLRVRCKHKKHRRVAQAGRSRVIVLDDRASPGDVVPLELETDGEDVRVVSVEERSLSDGEIHDPTATPQALGFTALETSVAAMFQWRDGRVGGDFAREQRFFNDMERQTWTSTSGQDAVLALLAAIFAKRHAGDLVAVAALEQSADVNQLTAISNLLKGCMQTHFGDPMAHLLEIEDAFDRFARGDLSLLDGTDSITDPAFQEYKARACQPDSAYYMYFAEFASVCFRKGVDAPLWQALLPALVQTQEIFFEAYKGPGGDPIPLGLPLGGRWPQDEASIKSPDDMHRERAQFKAAYLGVLDDVRINYARQFVAL